MPGHFTFIDPEWDRLISDPLSILPGIEKISAIFFSRSRQSLALATYDREGNMVSNHEELLNNPEYKVRLQRFRSTSVPHSWIKLEESPLLVGSEDDLNADLFSELQNTILVLRIKNESDGKYDALLVYFNKNLNQFGVSISDKILSIENKSIISNILYHYFKKIHKDSRHNFTILQSVQQSVQSISREHGRVSSEILQLSRNLEEMIVNLAQHYLKNLSEKYGREFIFSADAMEKLKSYRGNVTYLNDIIEQGIVFSINLMHVGSEGVNFLDSSMISFDNFMPEEEESTILKRIDSRESKTILLLDRLEKSAGLVKSQGLPITGVNVGKHMHQPITAPAITDALRKHKSTILQLMTKYPGKWEIIRGDFRPVQNLFKRRKETGGKQNIA
jgi:hypothetical protein